ncbi:L-aspartate oxidase [Rubrobacter indicoceani]|uniref:L-aspartate oxidase n=1 Tax=Rubrobacter indicoceani TaxID=2051957 RepID=UPI000E5C1477|nr:L-aspartate oxidase [Rubrobacter indicoceani]
MSRARERYDVIVVGAGVAGCVAALAAARAGSRVALLTKAPEPEESNTRYAQGGIIYTSPDDSPELLAEDVMEAGVGAGDRNAVRLLAAEGPEMVRRLLVEELGVPFDRGKSGELKLTREGAHSVARIIHRKDTTGDAIQNALTRAVAAHERIELPPCANVLELLVAEGRCVGVAALLGGELTAMRARAVVLATGGFAGLYERTTNPAIATGDGLALALSVGARVRDLHYVQFHPTVLYRPDGVGRAALISEAVRGEGAVLVDGGEEFIEHPGGSLAPRDVVTREISTALGRSGLPCVYLDATPERTGRPKGWFATRFPEIHARCMEAGISPDENPIPVSPAAHYTCGGVLTDLSGRTSFPGLLAAGEVASTGIHGANRLASTSLLEGLLFGWRAGEAACRTPDFEEAFGTHRPRSETDPESREADLSRLRGIMWRRAGIVRDADGLEAGLRELERLAPGAGLAGPLLVTRSVLKAALLDKANLGCHYRSDAHSTGGMEYAPRRLAGLPG